MEIDVATISSWMDQLDPSGTVVDPCDTNPLSVQVRSLLDNLTISMQKFLQDNGYHSTEQGWVK